ncbi:MAG: SGNH/GDSL hydrolase family protein [Clostridiales bacterium]|nr:SGNH/GDSL hydrolase family protein [Clostridiales bacterium]
MSEIRQPMIFKIDVKSGLVEMPQRAVLMKGDKNANTVTAEIVDGDKEVDISGAAVTASFLIGGVKIPLTGEVSENKASVTLPEECYRASGRYELRMMLSASDVTRTILFISGHMESDGEGGILDVEGVIPSVQDIIAQYATMQAVTAQTQAAADAALEAAKSANFTVLDRFDTYDQLIAAHPTGEAGQAFAVGAADNNVVYIWGIDTLSWVNIGPVQGAVGPEGPTGRGIQSIMRTAGNGAAGTVDTYTVYYTDGGTWTYQVHNGTTGPQGPAGYTPVRGTDYWTAADQQGIKNYIDENTGTKYGKAVFFGDSITQGIGNNDISFVDYLAESGDFESVKKRGVVGASIVPYQGDSVTDYAFINQVNRYAADVQEADIVFVEYGANDIARVAKGESFNPGFATDSASQNTICGYARRGLERIKELAPHAWIVWLQWMPWRSDAPGIVGTDEAIVRKVNDAWLLYEATLYRLVRNCGCTIIDMSLGIEYGDETFVAEDMIHGNEAGYRRAAETVLASMYGNNGEKNLYRVYTVSASSQGNIPSAQIDGDFTNALALLKAGGVEVSVNLIIGGVYYTHFKPVAFNENFIVFGSIVGGENTQSLLTMVWQSDGTLQYREG